MTRFWLTTLSVFNVIFSEKCLTQDTFSIVAFDPLTGIVGSAGASCRPRADTISDVHPGVGGIHTQGNYRVENQNYAKYLMNQGISPQQIIDSLIANDIAGDPFAGQYIVIDLTGGGRSAAYTGISCLDYKNQILGPNYVIAGNILLGRQILDSMEARFLSTPGTLGEKLMAALQGAKVPGADIRCPGRSSMSAFIRAARPQDTLGSLYLDLRVRNLPDPYEPIDSLQILYNQWKTANSVEQLSRGIPISFALRQNFPNPFNPSTEIQFLLARKGHVTLTIFDLLGRTVTTIVSEELSPGSYSTHWNASGFSSGVYLYKLQAGDFVETKRMLLLK